MIIFIEGVDKTGKDTLLYYLNQYTNYEHYISARGPISTMVYAEKFGRKPLNFDYLRLIKEEVMFVLLTSEEKDLSIRFKMTHEPQIDVIRDAALFNKYFDKMKKYGVKCVTYNTSYMTPTQICMSIQNVLKEKK